MGEIKRSYLNQRLSGSFSGVSGFVRNRKKWSDKKEVEAELRKLNAYALHKDVRTKFKRRPTSVHLINEVWASDLKDVSSLAEYNNCNTFVLVVVDGFSKKGYARLLKSKRPADMIAAFTSIFKEAKAKPMYLFTDRGLEYTSNKFRKFLSDNNVKPYHTYSHIKSSFAERFIRTLFTKLQRYMTEKQTKKFDNVLKQFVATYNNTYHRTIKRAPNAVKKEDEYEIWHDMFKKHIEEKKLPRKPAKFHVGDWVRISRAKLTFEKGK